MPAGKRPPSHRLACRASAVGLAGVGMGSWWLWIFPRKSLSTLHHSPGVRIVRIVVLDRRLDEVFTLAAEPHRDCRGDEDRRVDAEQDADRQRDGEVVQRLAAED